MYTQGRGERETLPNATLSPPDDNYFALRRAAVSVTLMYHH